MKRPARLKDLFAPKSPSPEPSPFVKELVHVLPYLEIPSDYHAQEVVDFFLDRGWTPPCEAQE